MMENEPSLYVLIACHKPCQMPESDCYLPVEVGAAMHDYPIQGCSPDNTGDSISDKNLSYCELTGLYWAWKNLKADYIGLVHYRRYFAIGPLRRRIAEESDYREALTKAPVILPKKRHYWIETNYSQYIHAHHEQDLAVTREVIEQQCPDYLSAYDSQMSRRSGHRFNMFVMRRDLFDDYCIWLFSILFEMESRLDTSDYDEYNRRVFGFVAERLLDVWIEKNQVPYTEMQVIFTEKQHWLRKGTSFILRKMGYVSRKKNG